MTVFYHDTPENVAYFSEISHIPPLVCKAWLRCEGQLVDNPTNPLNILRYPSHTMQIGAKGAYATYHTVEDGLRDVVTTLQLNYYDRLNLAIRGGDPVRIAREIELSPWAAGHYGAKYDPSILGCISKTYAKLAKDAPKSAKQKELDAIRKRAIAAGNTDVTDAEVLATYNRNKAREKKAKEK